MKEIDFNTPNIVTMLVYGTTGCGKTHFAATAIDSYKTLYLNTEEKTSTLSKWGSKLQKNGSRAFWIDSQAETREILSKLRDKQTYEVLVIDSLSRYQLLDQLAITGDKRDKTTQEDFGKLHIHMSQTMLLTPKNSMHMIVTALAEEYTRTFANGTKGSRFRPSLIGKFGSLIGGWFNIMAFMEFDGTTRRMHFVSGPDFDAKSEFDMPPYLDNPTFGDVVKLINKGGESRTDKE